MSDELTKIKYKLNILNTRLEILKGLVKSCENIIVKEHRKKWWLEHPEVAYFTAHTSWETERWTLERYLDFYVESVIGIDGSQLDFQNRGWFVNYPALEEDVQDDDALMIYRNPFLCT